VCHRVDLLTVCSLLNLIYMNPIMLESKRSELVSAFPAMPVRIALLSKIGLWRLIELEAIVECLSLRRLSHTIPCRREVAFLLQL
jgi:hypothetical protein